MPFTATVTLDTATGPSAPDGTPCSITVFGQGLTANFTNNVASVVVPDSIIGSIQSGFVRADVTLNGQLTTLNVPIYDTDGPSGVSTITNLRVEDITQTEAVLKYTINPAADSAVEISVDGGAFQALVNTGVFAVHTYAIHNQFTLTAGTSYTMRVTPSGETPQTVSFTTAQVSAVTNLRIGDITATQARIKFDMDPAADCQVEISVDGGAYQSLVNTGVFAVHNYAIHNQITLNPETSYSIRLTPSGEPPQIVSFQTTAASAGNGDEVIPSNLPSRDGRDNTEYGNWVGVAGVTAPPSGNAQFTRVEFRPSGQPSVSGTTANGHFGSDRRLDINGLEAWLSYWQFLGNDFAPDDNMKFMGFSSQHTGNAAINQDGQGGLGGGQGGLGGGGQYSFSCRSIMQEAGQGFPAGLGFEVYHDASPTQPRSDPEWWGNNTPNETSPQVEAEINDGQWHRIINYIKLNDRGSNNGILRAWLDENNPTTANAIYNRTGLGFTDNIAYHNLAIWFNNFHGGSGVISSKGTVFYDSINYSEGPVNGTY